MKITDSEAPTAPAAPPETEQPIDTHISTETEEPAFTQKPMETEAPAEADTPMGTETSNETGKTLVVAPVMAERSATILQVTKPSCFIDGRV